MSPIPASAFLVRNDTNFERKKKKEYEETHLKYEKITEYVRFSASLAVVFVRKTKITSDCLN